VRKNKLTDDFLLLTPHRFEAIRRRIGELVWLKKLGIGERLIGKKS
jgi:hypothetical protein